MATTMVEPEVQETSKPASKSSTKYVYSFGGGKADGNGKMKDVPGGKGAGLAEMSNAGLPVPPGFTIQTEACREYMRKGGVSQEVDRQMNAALAQLETLQGQKLGKGQNPLLVSVRSGAKFSMPGMMDTILNLGLNDESVEALAKAQERGVAVRVLINGAPIGAYVSRRHAHDQSTSATDDAERGVGVPAKQVRGVGAPGVKEDHSEGIVRDRWDVAVETLTATVLIECGAIRERVSQELARKVFDAIKSELERRDA